MLTTAVLTGPGAYLAGHAARLTGPGGHPGWGWGPGWFLLLIPLFWVLFIVLVVAILGRRWRRGGGPGAGYYGHQNWQAASDTRSAEKTLAERFAHGDIDEVEYRARLEVLRANRPDSPAAPR